MDRPCLFCEIVAGREPAHVVWRDALTCAFLDRSPVFPGHVLVVPIAHVVTLDELDPELLAPVFGTVRRVCASMSSALGADGSLTVNNNVVSQSVAHLHVHVIPRRRKDGLRHFLWPRRRYADDAEAEVFASALREALAAT
jgi:histidine triad (HIT) family protein